MFTDYVIKQASQKELELEQKLTKQFSDWLKENEKFLNQPPEISELWKSIRLEQEELKNSTAQKQIELEAEYQIPLAHYLNSDYSKKVNILSTIGKLFFDKNTDLDKLNYIFEGVIINKLSQILENFQIILQDNLIENKSYGDYDDMVTILRNDIFRQVFVIQDMCTTGSEQILLFVNDLKSKKFHVRVVWKTIPEDTTDINSYEEYSDYPKSQYPNKPSVAFHFARGYDMNYIEEYHMTNLGSVYGDIRDAGYVISFGYGDVTDYSDLGRLVGFYNRINGMLGKLNYIVNEIKNE